jgi:hypothetical protein
VEVSGSAAHPRSHATRRPSGPTRGYGFAFQTLPALSYDVAPGPHGADYSAGTLLIVIRLTLLALLPVALWAHGSGPDFGYSGVPGEYTLSPPGGSLPTQLDGVKVAIDGKPAFVEYVSPALFLWSGKYAATTRPDHSLVGPPNLFPGVTSVPARHGDVIILRATGFGPTSPSAVPAGINTPSDTLYNTSNRLTVMTGNITATVLASVLTPGNAGLRQIAVTVPLNSPVRCPPHGAAMRGEP